MSQSIQSPLSITGWCWHMAPFKGLPGVECHTRRAGVASHSTGCSTRSVDIDQHVARLVASNGSHVAWWSLSAEQVMAMRPQLYPMSSTIVYSAGYGSERRLIERRTSLPRWKSYTLLLSVLCLATFISNSSHNGNGNWNHGLVFSGPNDYT